ncbi:MAG: hypothetical protein ABW061_10195 [Polyangiaceae bacterium]
MLLPSRLLPSLLLALTALSSLACQSTTSTCSRDTDLVTVLPPDGIVDGKTYRSSNFGGPYQYFPPNRTISFEHGLGVIPYSVQLWVAFSSEGTLAPAAGNMAELRGADGDSEPALDQTRIAVHNDTCTDFYLWVVATAP